MSVSSEGSARIVMGRGVIAVLQQVVISYPW